MRDVGMDVRDVLSALIGFARDGPLAPGRAPSPLSEIQSRKLEKIFRC